MRQVYQSDSIKLDAAQITEHDHDTFGKVTVFHDVPIASEMVQPYDDGRAWKHRDELEPYSWTVDGAWVIVGGHPAEGIISDRAQVSGRTVNPRYVKDLKDPKTKRPNRAGVRADIEIFNDKVPKETLDDMKNGKLQDVSIGFFYSKDESAGVIEDGPFKGDEYDYIQRNMFHNHTAAGIDNGRCPMPFCGLGADELRKRLAHDPFAGFEDFDACMAHMMKPKDEGGEGYDEETAKKVCGKLKEEHEDINKEEDALNNAKKKAINALLEILDAVEAAKGELDAKKTDKETWWMSLNWRDEDMLPIYQILDEETRQKIIEAELCPTCGDAKPRSEAERAKAHFELTDEEWEALSDEEKQEYIDKLPERGSGGDMSLEDIDAKLEELKTTRKGLQDKIDELYEKMNKIYEERTEKASEEEDKLQNQVNALYETLSDLDVEIQTYLNAKAMKIAEADYITYEDGRAIDFTLTAVDEKPVEKKAILDPREVLDRADRLLR